MKKLILASLLAAYCPLANATPMGLIEPPLRDNFPCPDLSMGFVLNDYVKSEDDGWYVASMYKSDGSFWSGWDYIDSGSRIKFDDKTVYHGLSKVEQYGTCYYRVTHNDEEYTVDVTNYKLYNCKVGSDGQSLDCEVEDF